MCASFVAFMTAFAVSIPIPAYSKSNRPPPAPIELPTRDQKDAGQNAPAAAEQENRGSDERPVSVKVIPGEKSERDTRKEQYEADEKPGLDRGLTSYTGWLVVFTAALFFAALGQVVLFFWQLGLIRDSLADTKLAAEAAKEAAEAGKVQAEVAKATMDIEHRPYIFIYGISGLKVKRRPCDPYIEYIVANYGKTPAIVLSAKADFLVVHNGKEVGKPADVISGELYGRPIIGPGAVINTEDVAGFLMVDDEGNDFDFEFETRFVDDEEIGEAWPKDNGIYDIYFRVIISYKGPNTIGHETSACWRYSPGDDGFIHDGPNYEK